MKRFIQKLGLVVSLIISAAIVLSFAGYVFPFGDSLAVFRLPLLLTLVLSTLLSQRMSLFGVSILLVILVLVSDAQDRFGYSNPEDGAYRVYQKNISPWVEDPRLTINDILNSKSDFVFFQELYEHNHFVLTRLQSEYPYQHWCSQKGRAVLSRHPFSGTKPICDRGIVLAKVKGIDTDIWIGSIHLSWPWPHDQAGQVDDMVSLLESQDAPVILAGDLNAVPWSGTVKKLSRAVNGERVGPLRSSFDLLPLFSITIDHVIAGGRNYRTERRPKFGSDHYGLIADVEPTVPN